MIYVLFNKDVPVKVTSESPFTGTPQLKDFGIEYDSVKGSHEIESFEEAEKLAAFATENTGKLHLGADASASVSPRFSIFEPPAMGDEVSYAFNGDYNPCGTIVKITKGFRITTSTGRVFNRAKKSAGWLMVGGTYRLVGGHISERNPSY